jgi:ABC-type transport system substrate-binding protein
LGADVNVEIYETGDLNQNIIRPRKYESLFFGEVIGRELDLYPFWHSSQRNDPGLNIAVYVNSTVDKILEETRSITDPAVRDAKYASLKEEIGNDMPVVFTYSPDFLYILPKKIQNVSLTKLTIPSERFLNVSGWYIETNKVWKIFTRKNN